MKQIEAKQPAWYKEEYMLGIFVYLPQIMLSRNLLILTGLNWRPFVGISIVDTYVWSIV